MPLVSQPSLEDTAMSRLISYPAVCTAFGKEQGREEPGPAKEFSLHRTYSGQPPLEGDV